MTCFIEHLSAKHFSAMNMFMPHHIAIRVTRCWPHTAHSNQPRTSGSTVCGRNIFGRNMRGRNNRSGAVFGMMANSGLFHQASFCQTFFCHQNVSAAPRGVSHLVDPAGARCHGRSALFSADFLQTQPSLAINQSLTLHAGQA